MGNRWYYFVRQVLVGHPVRSTISVDSFVLCSSGKPDTPGIYTRVGTYNSFIRSAITLSKQNTFYSSSACRLASWNLLAIVFVLL